MVREEIILEYLSEGKYYDIANIIVSMSGAKSLFKPEVALRSPEKVCSEFGLGYIELEKLDSRCIYGWFDNQNKNICVYRTSFEHRNLFTLSHEIGHFLIETSDLWNCLIVNKYIQKLDSREKIEESLANAIASELLIESKIYQNSLLNYQVDSKSLVKFYEKLVCSPSAFLNRVAGELRGNFSIIVGYSDLAGKSLYNYSLDPVRIYPISNKISQPVLAEIGEEIGLNGRFSGTPLEPVKDLRGRSRGNFIFEAEIDSERYGFFFTAIPSKTAVAGNSNYEILCSGCSEEIENPNFDTLDRCDLCESFLCNECRVCNCKDPLIEVCSICFLALSSVDRSEGREVHVDCE